MKIEKIKNCGECRYFNPVSSLCIVLGGKVSKLATGCPANYIKQHALFQEITASPEVLAKELITTSYDEFKDCTVYWAWLGNGRREAYYSKHEAIAATVAKLKEVCDE